MALINKNKYSGLSNYSTQTNQKRKAGMFKSVYITGQPRDGETVGTMQIIKSWEGESPEFVSNNQKQINFVLLFIKKLRVNNNKDGKTICFSYSDKIDAISTSGKNCPSATERQNGFCDNCRFHLIFAGVLLDEKMKTVSDDEGNPVFIFFRNNGMKYMGGSDYINELQERATELKPLSDDIEFEANVVTPRRFITRVSVGLKSSDYGNKSVFEYTAIKSLPDKVVVKMLEDSEKYTSKFDEQFDLSKIMTTSAPTTPQTDSRLKQFPETNSSDKDESIAEENTQSPAEPSTESDEDFNLDDIDIDI